VIVRIGFDRHGMALIDVLPRGWSARPATTLTVVSGTDTTHFTIPAQMEATPSVRDADRR